MMILNRQKTLLVAAMTLTMMNVNAMNDGRNSNNIADSSRIFDIEEVVVVAQPKEVFRLRMQPSSSSSYSSYELKSLNVRDVRDLSAYTPAFVMPDYGARLTSAAYIRGTGSRINNPAIGIYFDGIPIINKNAYNSYTYATERIDILRGPQGTLYGQNTEGGLIRMYSQNPLTHSGTDIKLGFGTHFQRNAEVVSNIALGAKLGMTVAGFYNGTNGFLRNTTTNERADKMNEAGGRVRMAFQPSRSFSINWTADYQYVRQNAFAYGLLDLATNTTASPNTNLQSNYRRNIFNTGLTLRHTNNCFELNSTTSYQYLKDYMLMDQDYTETDYMQLAQRQFQNVLTEELTLKSRSSGRWQWTTGAFASYQWLKTNAPVDFGTATTQPIANGIQRAMYSSILSSMVASMVEKGMPEATATALATSNIEKKGGISMDVTMSVPGQFRTPHLNLAVFHESNINITDRLIGTIGLRYDFSRTSIEYDTRAAMNMTANVMGTSATYTLASALNDKAHSTYNQVLPKAAITFLTDNNNSNVYFSVSKGYRAGGYNIQMFSDILRSELNTNSSAAMRGSYDVPHTDEDYNNIKNTIEYKPEFSWNYEIGTRQNLFNNAVHIDLAFYYMRIRNQQLSVMAGNYGYGRMMVNAGRSRSMGFEAAIQGKMLNNDLSWALSYGYNRATFTNYKDTQESESGEQEIDYKGKRVPYVPSNTLGAAASYRLKLNDKVLKSITFGLNFTAQGNIYWNEANSYSQPFYALLDGNVSGDIGFANISFWCRNITNTKYNSFAINSEATGTELFFAQKGRPISCGVTLGVHI